MTAPTTSAGVAVGVSGVLLAKVLGRQDRAAERYQAANERLATL